MPSSRRQFLRMMSTVGAAVSVAWDSLVTRLWAVTPLAQESPVDRLAIMKAFGDTMIPSASGDPGYKELEVYGISEEVLKALRGIPDDTFGLLESSATKYFGKVFTSLDEEARAEYYRNIISGQGLEPDAQAKLQAFYRAARVRVLTVFYQNFPEDKVKRDSQGFPVLPANDLHQITTPNTKKIVTGWDIAGWKGPLTWEEEQELRAQAQKIHWHEDTRWP